MNNSAVKVEIGEEIKGFKAVTELTLSELGKEVSRLKHLRAESRRLNEAAFRDALAAAEAKAPALIPSNAMLRLSEIEEIRQNIEEESRVIGPETFTLLTDRITLIRGEMGRRRLCAARAVA